MGPTSPNYRYEIARLQIQYRTSQERLRISEQQAEAQRVLFEQDRAAREQAHQQEVEEIHRSYSERAPGKGKAPRRM
jgi:hypothetical protein